VVANACNTPVGVYDPLRPIGEFCRAHGIWLHIDGAHGASALVSPTHRRLLDGIDLADSLTWDAHKMLRAPTLCAALLVRDHRTLDAAFQQEASYLFHEKEQPGVDFAQRTVECTKAGLGLKVFMVLGALGERGLAEYLDHEHALTQQAYEYLAGQPDLACAVRPESNILCFRVPGTDAKQLRIRDVLNEEGSYYLSSTVFGGRRYLRMVLINPVTSFADIERCVGRVREVAAEIPD
jgi:L-2,4-diaminobutyrate decarboxylase